MIVHRAVLAVYVYVWGLSITAVSVYWFLWFILAIMAVLAVWVYVLSLAGTAVFNGRYEGYWCYCGRFSIVLVIVALADAAVSVHIVSGFVLAIVAVIVLYTLVLILFLVDIYGCVLFLFLGGVLSVKAL